MHRYKHSTLLVLSNRYLLTLRTITSGAKRSKSRANKELHSSATAQHSTSHLDFVHSSASIVHSSSNPIPRPGFTSLKSLFVASAIPMVGFGFMDNVVMIQAGQAIDSTIGVQLALHTLTAAAMGQVVSDVCGVVFGGSLERFLTRMNLIANPGLTTAQRQLPICRNVSMAGAVLGVICGCLMGATTLLLVDLDARDRIDRATKLREIVTDMENATLKCDGIAIYLKDNKFYAPQDKQYRTQLIMLNDSEKNEAHTAASKRRNVFANNKQILFIPILHEGELMGVIEYRRGSQFSAQDEVAAKAMASHLAIFMKQLLD